MDSFPRTDAQKITRLPGFRQPDAQATTDAALFHNAAYATGKLEFVIDAVEPDAIDRTDGNTSFAARAQIGIDSGDEPRSRASGGECDGVIPMLRKRRHHAFTLIRCGISDERRLRSWLTRPALPSRLRSRRSAGRIASVPPSQSPGFALVSRYPITLPRFVLFRPLACRATCLLACCLFACRSVADAILLRDIIASANSGAKYAMRHRGRDLFGAFRCREIVRRAG